MHWNNQKGFTYVEVIISFALLLAVFVPVLAGCAAAVRNQRHAAEYYVGGLNADRLLLGIDGLFWDNPELLGDGVSDTVSASLGENFDAEYNTDKYAYRADIYEIAGGVLDRDGLNVFMSGEPGEAGDIEFSAAENDLFEFEGLLLAVGVYDSDALLIKRALRLCDWGAR